MAVAAFARLGPVCTFPCTALQVTMSAAGVTFQLLQEGRRAETLQRSVFFFLARKGTATHGRRVAVAVAGKSVTFTATPVGGHVPVAQGGSTPESGLTRGSPSPRRPTPKVAGDGPKERRAPIPKLDRYRYRHFLISAVTCPRSDRQIAILPVSEITSTSRSSACQKSWSFRWYLGPGSAVRLFSTLGSSSAFFPFPSPAFGIFSVVHFAGAKHEAGPRHGFFLSPCALRFSFHPVLRKRSLASTRLTSRPSATGRAPTSTVSRVRTG